MDTSQLEIAFQLILATILGGILGFERKRKGKEAGLQTYSLVTLGACVFTLINNALFVFFNDKPGSFFDPSRIILAVATGIGFIGAGMVIYKKPHLEGVTTAAGLWTTAAIGVAVGIRLYFLAVVATILTLIIFFLFEKVERGLLKKT